MKTFNKRGDAGETSLLYGPRVPKNHPRCEAYGTIDEVVSILGLARCLCKRVSGELLLDLQLDLFKVGAELATPEANRSQLEAKGGIVTPAMANGLEAMIAEFESKMEMPRAFVLPGGVQGSATLDMARSALRRAERRVVDLTQTGEVKNPAIESLLNRMADLLFTLARYEEGDQCLTV